MASTSDFNLTTVNTVELEQLMRATIEFGGNIFVCGRRGSAKTWTAKKTAEQSDCKLITINLATADRQDVAGFPDFFAAKTGKRYVDYLMPAFYKDVWEGEQKVVLMFDECDKVDTSLLAPLLEITQFRSINGQKMKNLRACFFTGNLIAEGGQRPSLPLLDRCSKFLVEVVPKQWLYWAGDEGKIHPAITSFIHDHTDCLYGEVDAGDLYADESPRGWHNASDRIKFGEERGWPIDLILTEVAGCVGRRSGLKFQSYFKYYKELLPIIDKVMAGEKAKEFNKLEPTQQFVVCMIVCSRVSNAIDNLTQKQVSDKHIPESVSYAGKFLRAVDPEMALISIRSQISLRKMIPLNLIEHGDWGVFLDEIVAQNMKK